MLSKRVFLHPISWVAFENARLISVRALGDWTNSQAGSGVGVLIVLVSTSIKKYLVRLRPSFFMVSMMEL